MKAYITLAVLLCTGFAHAQFLLQRSYITPDQSYGSEICLLDDGGYVVTGMHNGATLAESGYYVLRLDENGDTIWTRVFKTENASSQARIIPVSSGGFLMTGGYGPSGIVFLHHKLCTRDTVVRFFTVPALQAVVNWNG